MSEHRTMRGLAGLAISAAIAVAGLVAAPAAAGTGAIQPGASIYTAATGYCTLNWIYDEVLTPEEAIYNTPRVFGGTAAHCVSRVGEPVELADGTLGSPLGAFGAVAYIDNNLDYALIEIDAKHLAAVDPAMKGHPGIPTGVSTRETAKLGDVMQFSGHGLGFHATQATQEGRQGFLNYNDGTVQAVTGPVSNGDSGGPVADLTDGGKAFGIVDDVGAGISDQASTVVMAGEGGLALEGILSDVARTGLHLRIRLVS